ncbi:MAG: T9SS type A sorting domain-containing protein [Bacteroidetes bacterium]|nr:T9SS type A sorting domain-containing protein [Bacteroidota bacterium]
MKKQTLRNPLARYIATYVGFVLLLLTPFSNGFAQCMSSGLNISTGAIENRHINPSYPSGPYDLPCRRDPLTSQGPHNDRRWKIVSVTTPLASLLGITSFGYNARIVPPCASWHLDNANFSASGTNTCHHNSGICCPDWHESHWITPANYVNGYTWPMTTDATPRAYTTTFRREFTTCQDGDFSFNFVLACDNYCYQIRVDGAPVSLTRIPQTAGHVPGYYDTFQVVTVIPSTPSPNNWFLKHLAAGGHYIDIDIVNFNTPGEANPHGMNLCGTIWDISNASSIVNDLDPNCSNPCPPVADLCDESCFWRLKGNNIGNVNDNIFGTINDFDIRIASNLSGCGGAFRGVIKGGYNTDDGGFLGWNTMSPTARLHVNCNGGNSSNGYNPTLSDIRFEALEQKAEGKILSIDAQGYVYNTNIDINTIGSGVTAWNLSGNSTGSNDWLGTINNNPLKIFTNKGTTSPVPRMIINGSPSNAWEEGFVGINNGAPTARLHVDCSGGNENNGLSDIRFQGLEVNNNELKLLGIDANGYVYNTNKTLSTTVSTSNSWDYTGNTAPSTSIFGITTTTGQDIDIRTDGVSRGVFDHAGNFGWHLSGLPTTSMHVDASNPANPTAPSGIRFENLPPNNGEVIVVDPQGYVFNSGIKSDDIQAILGDGGLGMMKQNIDDVKKQLEEQKLRNEQLQSELNTINARLAQLTSNSGKSDTQAPGINNELYQNTPNPFGAETSIGFSIVKMQQSAYIAIYDLNGRELYRYHVTAKGKGSITVSGEKLVPGQYLYSLIVDGQEVDTKKMVVTK